MAMACIRELVTVKNSHSIGSYYNIYTDHHWSGNQTSQVQETMVWESDLLGYPGDRGLGIRPLRLPGRPWSGNQTSHQVYVTWETMELMSPVFSGSRRVLLVLASFEKA